jgi:hypothetical protein
LGGLGRVGDLVKDPDAGDGSYGRGEAAAEAGTDFGSGTARGGTTPRITKENALGNAEGPPERRTASGEEPGRRDGPCTRRRSHRPGTRCAVQAARASSPRTSMGVLIVRVAPRHAETPSGWPPGAPPSNASSNHRPERGTSLELACRATPNADEVVSIPSFTASSTP